MTKMNLKEKMQHDALDLSLCDLEDVPVKELATLRRLAILDLSNNALSLLPKNFVTLTRIVKLDLSKNMLTEIPENFGEMKQLRHLDLYSNQISRLPLSLGELKKLKWLDLKENPLTPAVASVAGPCSNAAQCQACARNIVNFLSKASITIDEEKQRRIIATTTDSDKSTPSIKKEGKKKKKNTENEKKNVDKKSPVQKQQQDERTQETSTSKQDNQYGKKSSGAKGGIFSLLCRAFTSLILWSVFFMVLAAVAICVFPLYDKQKSEELFDYLETQTGLPAKHYADIGLDAMLKFVDKTVTLTNHAWLRIEDQQYFNRSSSQEL